MSVEVSAGDLRTRMQNIDPYEFEHFVAELWEKEGWDTTVSQASNDLGVDVIAEKNGTINQRLAIQAKRYSDGNKVSRPQVQQYYSLKEQDTSADAAVVVTTSDFTKDAKLWAMEQNVKLVNGDDLVDMVRRHDQIELLDEYAPELTEIVEKTSSKTSTKKTTTSNSDGNWIGAVFLAFLAEVGGFYLLLDPTAVPAVSEGMAAGVLLFAMIAMPLAVFLDSLDQHKSGASYKPNRVIWPMFTMMVPVIAPLFYLYRRLQ